VAVRTKSDFANASAGALVHPAVWLRRRLRTGFVDMGVWAVATLGAFLLRYDGRIPDAGLMVAVFAGLTIIKLIASTAFGLHRQSWRKFAFVDARTVVVAIASTMAIGTLVAGALPTVPVAIPVIDGVLSLVLMLGARYGVRYVDEGFTRKPKFGRRTRNVLLVGAGEAGSILVREMLRHPETGMRPIGFLDDDAAKTGITIGRVPVLGRLSQLKDIVATQEVDEVLICIPSSDGRAVRRIVDRVREAAPHATVRTMPALHEVLSGQVQINRIRNVTIDDLLRRPTVELDAGGILSYLHGKRVLVTGAGGSIGSELVRQICRFEPAELILFGHGENSIYQLERELDVDWPGIRYTSVIAAVQNVVRLENVFQRYKPDVIFHTAAHKHVPLMEQNPEEAVFNNIVGSRNLVELALKYGVTHFVNISTDKAVNPTSVMGASKRIVEMVVEAASRRATADQTFVSVRFGNVLGSRGSAVPIFKKQIADGGPVTVTHPDMVRYFMTIPEAARLVLQASAHGRNGEIYILDMGEPIKVVDLVKDLIRLSGLEPDIDIPIMFTGTRPGEKLYEELMTDQEMAGRTGHEKIFVARTQPMDLDLLDRTIEDLTQAALASDADEIRLLLSARIEGARLAIPNPSDDGDTPAVLA
jgi:FlaA1/EpsC-like NDP-sugar epimerase